MHEFKVLTVRNVSFMDDAGKLVSGRQLWLTAPIDDVDWQDGFEVLKIWFAEHSPHVPFVDELKSGDAIRIGFNRRGRPDVLELV